MTRVLNERYGFTMRGIGAFLLNRVLRLWPAYLVIMGLALIALRFLPLDNFFQLIRMPISPLEIITNLTVLGQVGFDYVQWLPLAKPLVTSWSLSIEIVSYLLLALYFAKSPSRLWAFAVLGVIAMAISTAWCATSPDPGAYGPYCFQNRYGVVQAGFIPFAFGGLYYFHRDPIADWIVRYRGRSVCLLGGALVTILSHRAGDGRDWSHDRHSGACHVFQRTADGNDCALRRDPVDLDAVIERSGCARDKRSGLFRTRVLSSFHCAHADRRCAGNRSACPDAEHLNLSGNFGGCAWRQCRPRAHGAAHKQRKTKSSLIGSYLQPP